jgi:hypothetical protein
MFCSGSELVDQRVVCGSDSSWVISAGYDVPLYGDEYGGMKLGN